MERLNEQAIWRFLDAAIVGRLAIHDHAQQVTELTPVFFAFDRGHIYFATQPGRKLTLLRAYPSGVGIQCDQEIDATWISVFGWGRYRDIAPGWEYLQATTLLAQKYRGRFVQQIAQQARQAIQRGPRGILATLQESTVGCIDLQRISGRKWSSNADT